MLKEKLEKLYFIFNFIKSYFFYKYRTFNNKAELQKFQFAQLKKFSRKILVKSPYYRDISIKIVQNNYLTLNELLSCFPVLEKQDFLLNFNRINTCHIDFKMALEMAEKSENTRNFFSKINNVDIGLSTGTSGRRTVFLVSCKERALWAGIIFARSIHSGIFKKNKIALLLRANNNLYESLANKKAKFKYFDILNPIEKIYSDLRTYDPNILVGPPSYIEFIARSELKLQMQNRMRFEQIICSAETLSDETRELLTNAWGKVPQQIYQATEGYLAYTCKEGSLHMNEDLLIIEKNYLDKEQGIFIPIITDFTRESQPIIRYKLTDVLVEDQTPCACGSVLLKLKRIEGRFDDVLFFSNTPVFPDFLTRLVLKSHSAISDFRIRQLTPNEIEVALKFEENKIQNYEGKSSELFEEAHACVSENLKTFTQNQNLFFPKYIKADFQFEPSGQKRRRVKRLYSL